MPQLMILSKLIKSIYQELNKTKGKAHLKPRAYAYFDPKSHDQPEIKNKTKKEIA